MVNEDTYLDESVKHATLDDDKFGQLREAMQKTVAVVETLPEPYRLKAFELAFPFVYKTFSVPVQEAAALLNDGSTLLANKGVVSLSFPPNLLVNEFLHKAAPSSHTSRFVCIAYYLLHTGKAVQFTVADILEVYSKVRQPKPANPTDVINQCIRKVHLTDADADLDTGRQKSWVITPTGERFVEELLKGVSNEASISDTPKAVTKAKKGVQRGRKSSTTHRRAISNPSA